MRQYDDYEEQAYEPAEFAEDHDDYDDYGQPAPEPGRAFGRDGSGPRKGKGYGLPLFLGMLAALAVFGVYREGRRAGQADGVPASANVQEGAEPSLDLNQAVRRVGVGAPVARGVDPTRVNELYNRSRRLMPHAARLGEPRPGEWRAMAREPSQTYFQFARDPQRPIFANHARTIVVQPFGDLSASGRRLLPLIGDYLSAFFDMPVRVVAPLPVASLPASAWRKNGGAHQLNAEYALSNILAPRLPADGAIIVGLTAADLTPGGRWNFENAFGWSSFYGRTAIISMARSFPGNDRREATMQDFVHLLKFASHEAVHALGLKHCDRYVCLMNGRASLQENAAKPMWLCPDCYAKMALATDFDDGRRAMRLATFCERQGLTSEREYWRNVGAQMQGR